LKEVELEYRREIEDLQKAFGTGTPLVVGLKFILSSILLEDGDFSGGEMVINDLTEELRTNVGAEHSLTLTSMANLATTFYNQGR